MKKLLHQARLVSKYATYGLLLQLFLLQTLFAQDIAVSGKVTAVNISGGLPAVSIVLEGTTHGAITDANGDYRIEIPNSESVLIFSSIGYTTQEIVVGNRSVIDVSLIEDITALEEVVVVGYGTRRKSDVTGAVASISEESLREMPAVHNPAELLQGKVAGVDVVTLGNKPGDGVSVLIRGKRSFSAGNDPLYVVDGIPVSSDALNFINPMDIVSMDVLKDASSTAIYGSRGANGVIIVTTRRGESGRLKVNYNGSFGIQKIMKYPDLMNGEQFAEYKRESRRSIGQYDDNDPNADATLFHSIELESIQQGRETDWYKLFVEDGYVQNHNLSISGGTEKGRYSMSFGLYDNEGIITNHKFKRYNVRLNLDQKIGGRVTVGISSLQTYSKSSALDVDPLFADGSDYGAFSENPLGVPYDDNGDLIFNNTPGDGNRTNPLADVIPERSINRRKSLKLFNSIYGEVDILDGLKFRMNFGSELTSNQLGDFRGSETRVNAGGSPSAATENEFITNLTWENILSYSKTIESHRFDFTGLYSRQSRQGEFFGSSVTGLPVDGFEYYNLGSASELSGISSSYDKWSIESWMGRLNYVFNDRYLLTLTGRGDGSSKFAEENKWGFFPSLALAWNITNEGFLAQNRTISDLRLRVSYGATGNQGIDP